jgi:hypothetical protein
MAEEQPITTQAAPEARTVNGKDTNAQKRQAMWPAVFLCNLK